MNYCDYFVGGVRKDTQEAYYYLADEAPEDLRDLVREIHKIFDCLPNDWIYGQIYEAFIDLKADDFEHITIESDVYHCELYKWLGEPYAPGLCDFAIEECNPETLWQIASQAQNNAKLMIYEAVDNFINNQEKNAEV